MEPPPAFNRFGLCYRVIASPNDHSLTSTHLSVQARRPRAHHLGINWSRAWALRALSRKMKDESARKRFDDAFLKHVDIGMKHHRKYVGKYTIYDHWVPQFAVYAMTE